MSSDKLSFDAALCNATDVRAKTTAGQRPSRTGDAVMANFIEPRMPSVRMTVES